MLNLKQTLYTKLVKFLIRSGKKKKAKTILDKAFLEIAVKTKHSLIFILLKVFLNLNPFVEARTFKIKKRTFVVPFSLTMDRRIYLIAKWLIKAISLNPKKQSFSKKLYTEVLLVLKKHPSSQAIKLKKANIKKANTNRSNIHFRW